MRYFIYCRKSSESEDRQVMSIESQLSTLQRTFGSKTEIEIVAKYEEAFSAKAPGRPRFDEMIKRMERGDAQGIIAWAPDRLARNSIDGGRVIYLLDKGVIRDLKFATSTFENNSQGKFMLQIMFGQSKYYSDALSENVKRGNRTKIERGWRPNQAPLGYLNDPVSRTIVKDPVRFPLVRRIFDLMLTGAYSAKQICKMARDELGFRTPKRKRSGGKPLALSGVYKLLKNPFYAGILVWAGRTYRGAHEPLASIEELDRIRALLRKRDKPRPHRLYFAFTGLIRCGECGLLITAENKINRYGSRYTYYHCTKRNLDSRCSQPSVRLEELEGQILDYLRGLSLPKKIHDWVVQQLTNTATSFREKEQSRRHSIEQTLEACQRALTNLTSLRIRDLIDDEQFIVERKKLDQEQFRLQESLQRVEHQELTFEPLETLISFSSRATDWFIAGENDNKRLILECVGSNLVLRDKKLSIEAKKPFQHFPKMRGLPRQRAAVGDIRTLYANRDNELLGILENIRKLENKFGIKRDDDHPDAGRRAA
jgi:DNA invertase Pin-like site-specific DNA recombinase